jgi:mono/diheme cytochrome c family protein
MWGGRTWVGAVCGLCVTVFACSEAGSPPSDATTTASPGVPIGPAAPPHDHSADMFVKTVPTDERPVTTVDNLPPISGGTLALTSDDHYAVVSDPDRDRVSFVDLSAQSLVATIPLTAGDEPGRVALDDAGRAHVALRRGGAVVSIDIATQTVLERREVCAAPRGIAYDASRQRLFVACQGGELVSLPVSGTDSITRQSIVPDLRDVVSNANGVFVSRFKSAELIALDPNGSVRATVQPTALTSNVPELDGSESIDVFDPLGARRVQPATDGTAIMLHQTARAGDIALRSESDPVTLREVARSAYGGALGRGCSGVAGGAITTFDSDGKLVYTVQLAHATLAVDIAISPTSYEVAVAIAGASDPYQPRVIFEPIRSSGSAPAFDGPSSAGSTAPNQRVTSVLRFDPRILAGSAHPTPGQPPDAPPCAEQTDSVALPSPATAVAYTTDERLIVQTREPASLYIASRYGGEDGSLPIHIDLGGASVLDTGHEIFHRDAGAGVTCATCHLEGQEDGHTWRFGGEGPRRTQDLSVGLEDTAPFHWAGDMTDLGALMESVFVGRMGGVHESQPRLDALARWIFSIKPASPLRAASDPAVDRGRELFTGAAECSTCHTGTKLTDNQTVDVGTGLALQVPSLIGVGLRGPWLHDGCAKTLQQRFDPECGGKAHGRRMLTAAQRNDLVAYLESL